MIGAVEPVSGNDLDLLPQRFALDVAGDDREVGTADELRLLQQARQRRARHHRLEPRQRARIGPLLDHRQQEVHTIGEQAVAGGFFGQEIEYRKPPVEAPRRQRGAARRTRDAHEALDLDRRRLERLDEPGEALSVIIVGLVSRPGCFFVER